MRVLDIKDYLHKHRWLVALCVVVVMGYTVGKDWALRDNARDQCALAADKC